MLKNHFYEDSNRFDYYKYFYYRSFPRCFYAKDLRLLRLIELYYKECKDKSDSEFAKNIPIHNLVDFFDQIFVGSLKDKVTGYISTDFENYFFYDLLKMFH